MSYNPSRKNSKDIQELEDSYQELSKNRSRSRSSGSTGKKQLSVTTILILLICILSVLIIVGAILIISMNNKDDKIQSDLEVWGVSLSGMTADEAEKALGEAFSQQFSGKTIALQIDELSLTISPEISGLKFDEKSAVQDALKLKKNDSTESYDESKYLILNNDALIAYIEEQTHSLGSALVQNSYEIIGQAPADLSVIDETVSQSLKITMGIPGKKVDTLAVIDLIRDAYVNQKTSISYECPVSNPDPLDPDAIFAENCSLPVDAHFEENTFKTLGGTYGYGFNIEEVKQNLQNAGFGEVKEFSFQWTAPAVTKEALEATLFQDVLSTYTTKAGSQGNRDVNIELASAAINGTILYPGDVFSYNGVVGERTPEKGYKPGATYVGGKTVMTYGGGICQVSTTLYYCTIVADLEVVERECHAYPSSYTPHSTDATVFWGGIDYKFRNNTAYPIKIEAFSDNGDVEVTFYGTDTKDYYVEFESNTLAWYSYDTVYEEYPPDNEEGYTDGQVIVTPYTGVKSEGWQVKYDKETGEEIERILVSTDKYSTRDKVIVKIVDPEAEGGEGGTEGGEGGTEGGEGGTEGGEGGTEGGEGGIEGGEGGTEGGEGGTEGGEGGTGNGENETGNGENGTGSGEENTITTGSENTSNGGSSPIELPMIDG